CFIGPSAAERLQYEYRSQPPHGAQIRMAMTVSGLMMAHQVAGKATRDAIFLSQFKTTALPTMVATAALAAVVISFWRGRTLVRFGPFRVTAVSFAASGVLHVAEWMLLRYQPRMAAVRPLSARSGFRSSTPIRILVGNQRMS